MARYDVGFILYLITIFISTATILWETSMIETTRKAVYLWLFQFLSIVWLVAGLIENLSTTNAELFCSIRFTLLPMAYIADIFLIFAMYYANAPGSDARISKETLSKILLSLSTLLYLPTITNKHFHLIIKYKDISNTGYTEWGSFFMIQYYLSITYVVLGMVLIIRKRILESRTHPNDTFVDLALFFIGILIPFTSNLMGWFVNFLPKYDITPIFFAVSNILIAWSLVKCKLLNTSVGDFDSAYLLANKMVILYNKDLTIRDMTKEAKTWMADNQLSDQQLSKSYLPILMGFDQKILDYAVRKKHFKADIRDLNLKDHTFNISIESITVENDHKGFALTLFERNTFNPDAYFKPREFLEHNNLTLDYIDLLNTILNDQSFESYTLTNNVSYEQTIESIQILYEALIKKPFNQDNTYKDIKKAYEIYKNKL